MLSLWLHTFKRTPCNVKHAMKCLVGVHIIRGVLNLHTGVCNHLISQVTHIVSCCLCGLHCLAHTQRISFPNHGVTYGSTCARRNSKHECLQVWLACFQTFHIFINESANSRASSSPWQLASSRALKAVTGNALKREMYAARIAPLLKLLPAKSRSRESGHSRSLRSHLPALCRGLRRGGNDIHWHTIYRQQLLNAGLEVVVQELVLRILDPPLRRWSSRHHGPATSSFLYSSRSAGQ